MARRVALSRRVRNWLDDQTDYLLAHSSTGADRSAERIANARRQIADFPHSGSRGRTPGTRRLVAGPYVLTCREAGPDLLIIVDIRHGRQREAPFHDELA